MMGVVLIARPAFIFGRPAQYPAGSPSEVPAPSEKYVADRRLLAVGYVYHTKYIECH